MNIYDISKKAGVSIATVSRVLNGSENVSEKTRSKVLLVMQETGYEPNIFARGLGLDTIRTVGILCTDSSDNYLAHAVYHLEQKFRQHQYDVLLCCTGYDLSDKQKYAKLLLSKRVDAVILVGSVFVEPTKEKNEYIYDMAKQVPVIMLNGYLEGENIYCAACDDTDAMYRTTKAFLEAGKEDILFFIRKLSFSNKKKIKGFEQAFVERGLALREEQKLIFNGNFDETKEMLKERFARKPKFDVILASDDEIAIGVLKYAKEVGISIPEGLQIVGYNNSKLAECCEPELTSVNNRLEYSCADAVNIFMRVIQGQDAPAKVMVSAEIQTRKTTNILF